MSNIKITQLPVATSLTGAEVVPLVQSGGTVQVAVSVFVDYLQDPGYFRAFPGTVSVVSYGFKNTPDTGIYSPATGQLGLVTVGAERLRIDSSGNVGIGTSAPLTGLQVSRGASEPLTEIGTLLVTGSTTAFRLAMGYSSGSNAGWIQSVQNGVNVTSILLNPLGGNVGIGTTAPSVRLHVDGAAITTRVGPNYNGGVAYNAGNQRIELLAWSGTPLLYIGRHNINSLELSVASDGSSVFAQAGSERLRIDASGNVGIGTSLPNARLDVNGDVAITGSARRILGDFSNASISSRLAFQTNTVNSSTAVGVLPNGTGNSANLLLFNNSNPDNSSFAQIGVTSGGTEVRIASGALGTGSLLPMTFVAGGSERLRIDASGNVRVGTAALATTATDGFLYIPTCPGTPTGVPTAITGLAPIVINSTNNKLYFYSGGAWRDAGP